MLKKALLLIILLFAVLAFIQARLNNPLAIIKSLKLQDKTSAVQPRLSFKVNFFGFLPVADARIEEPKDELYRGAKVVHLKAEATVSGFVKKFFNARAEVHSYIDKNKLDPLKFTQTLIIPDKPKDEKQVIYEQDTNIMELNGQRRQILAHTQDPLSAIYYMQHQDLQVGEEFDINLNTNQKNYRLFAKVVRREEHTLGASTVAIWVLEADISRRDKNPYHKSRISLWLLDSPAKIPLLIKARASGALITARLVEVSN